MRAIAIVTVLTGAWLATPADPAPQEHASMNFYDWMYPASVVLGGHLQDEVGQHTAIVVEEVFRGEIEAGGIVQVEVKRANREREDHEYRLKLDPHKSYLFLLDEAPDRKEDKPVSYRLARGVRGVREIPSEGAPALLEALKEFAQLQASASEELQWHRLSQMLEERNPIVLETALEQFLKFRRGTPELILHLRPLLDHPRPDVRELALELSGRILERYPRDEIPESDDLEMEIIALARRDPDVEVRIAATYSLAGVADAGVEQIWEEISEDDPDQSVRYAAERLLYERAQSEGLGANANAH